MKFWFFPVWSGDFRLEITDNKSECLLTVEDPTKKDRVVLNPFFSHARKEGWVEEDAGIQAKGKTEILVKAPLSVLGPLVAGIIHDGSETWTALRHVDGVISLHDKPLEVSKQLPAVSAVAAVTAKKPKKGCPAPTAAKRRASEVLQTFSTSSQWSQFRREGRMTAIGSHTGKAYHVYHRDQASREGLLHSLVEREGDVSICCWDDTVPPEEEMLSIKFAVEHRERWLRDLGTGPARLRRSLNDARLKRRFNLR